MRRGSIRAALESWVLPVLLFIGVIALARFLALPPLAAPDAKLAAALLKFDATQEGLARRLCARQPFTLGPMGFSHTGVSPGPMLHKALQKVSVRMQVEAVAPDAVELSLTMPELEADGLYWVLRREPVPAGTVLRSIGRCVEGHLYWAPMTTTLDAGRVQAARWRAAQ